MALEREQRISDVVERERSRLLHFIRRRVPDPRDAEDILQEVFYELVEANRLLMPIEHVTGWLYRVARNRITDLFRRQRPETPGDAVGEEGEALRWEDLLPSRDAGPEGLYARGVLLAELEQKLDDLGARVRVEIAGRLIGEQQDGAIDQRPRHRHALPLAAGQLGGPMVEPIRQPDALQ